MPMEELPMGTRAERPRSAARVLCWLALLGCPAVFVSLAAEVEETVIARAALVSQREVEQALLDEDRSRYPALAARRHAAEDSLTSLRFALRRAVLGETEDSGAARIERITGEVELAEARRTEAIQAERLLVERVRNRKRRIELIDAQLAALDLPATEVPGVLSGNWNVVLLPLAQRGVFRLKQSGTVVNGIYELDGGWSGSLQGTLINNKVFLLRIDSQLGKSMEFEGFLSNDRRQIRGTWLAYELADGKGGTGQWSARRDDDGGAGP